MKQTKLLSRQFTFTRWVKNWNRIFCQYTSNNDCLSQSASTALTKWQKKALEKSTWLEKSLPQCLVKVKIKPLVVVNVVSYSRQKNLEFKFFRYWIQIKKIFREHFFCKGLIGIRVDNFELLLLPEFWH